MAEGAGIRICDQFKTEASELFESYGFEPVSIEEEVNGEVRFVFSNSATELLPVLEAIPQEWWAVRAVVQGGGDA